MKIIRNDIANLADLLPGDVFELAENIYIVAQLRSKNNDYVAVNLASGETLDLDFEEWVSVYPNATIKLM